MRRPLVWVWAPKCSVGLDWEDMQFPYIHCKNFCSWPIVRYNNNFSSQTAKTAVIECCLPEGLQADLNLDPFSYLRISHSQRWQMNHLNPPSEESMSTGENPWAAIESESCFKSPKQPNRKKVIMTEELAMFPMVKFPADGMWNSSLELLRLIVWRNKAFLTGVTEGRREHLLSGKASSLIFHTELVKSFLSCFSSFKHGTCVATLHCT